ncbi:hypothetical protein QZH41_007214 [Actinostola sp. cb2023]|nr:hypothetical protein QZH41_007214 [Actinostola sp. cb2023]
MCSEIHLKAFKPFLPARTNGSIILVNSKCREWRSTASFTSFNLDDDLGAPGPRWRKYVARFRNLLVALNIESKPRQRALLLHYVGEQVNDIFETLPNTDAGEDENPLDKAIDALTAYFEPKKNLAYEEYQFRQTKQIAGESISAYHTRLRHRTQTCEFDNVDREIKSQIILHCTSSKLRRKALSVPQMSLEDLIEYGKTLELTNTQAASIEKQEINTLRQKTGTGQRNGPPKPKDRGSFRTESKSTKCGCCGGSYSHQGGRTACPAYKKECHGCGKSGHFKSVCRNAEQPTRPQPRQSLRRQRKVNTIDDDYNTTTMKTTRSDLRYEVSTETKPNTPSLKC